MSKTDAAYCAWVAGLTLSLPLGCLGQDRWAMFSLFLGAALAALLLHRRVVELEKEDGREGDDPL